MYLEIGSKESKAVQKMRKKKGEPHKNEYLIYNIRHL